MAMNTSWHGDNSSSSTIPPSTSSDNWWNATLPQVSSTNATFSQGPSTNLTLPQQPSTIPILDDTTFINNTPTINNTSDIFNGNNTTASTLNSTLLTPTILDTSSNTTTTNLTDPTTSMTNLNTSLTSDTLSFLTSTGAPVATSPNALPTTSATFPFIKPNVMGNSRLDASMWQTPGIIIGSSCLALGFACIIIGTFLRIRAKRQLANSTRRVRVMSGFDFNDGAEDDYQNNPWHKDHLGIVGNNEKLNHYHDLDGPITEMSAYRHSTPTVYSIGDDDDFDSNRSYQPHFRVETGFAQ